MALTDEWETWLPALMAYCRIDELGPGDEESLKESFCAAVGYMEGAGISEPEAGTGRRAQYDLCVKAMVLDDWDNRGTASVSSIQDNPAFRRRLIQLKHTEPIVSESGT